MALQGHEAEGLVQNNHISCFGNEKLSENFAAEIRVSQHRSLQSHFASFASVAVSAAAHGRRQFPGVKVGRRGIVVNHARRRGTAAGCATDGCARVTAVTPDPLPRWRRGRRHESRRA
jgi:hypothetical protein